jgi:hypothetical protein
MTRHEWRETRLLQAQCAAQSKTHLHHVAFSDNDPLPYTDHAMHHHISDSKQHSQDVFLFCWHFPADPAVKVSIILVMQMVLINFLLCTGLCPSTQRSFPRPLIK